MRESKCRDVMCVCVCVCMCVYDEKEREHHDVEIVLVCVGSRDRERDSYGNVDKNERKMKKDAPCCSVTTVCSLFSRLSVMMYGCTLKIRFFTFYVLDLLKIFLI